jgi:hypothetical protein
MSTVGRALAITSGKPMCPPEDKFHPLFILVAIVFALVSAGAATVVATALTSDAAMALAVR